MLDPNVTFTGDVSDKLNNPRYRNKQVRKHFKIAQRRDSVKGIAAIKILINLSFYDYETPYQNPIYRLLELAQKSTEMQQRIFCEFNKIQSDNDGLYILKHVIELALSQNGEIQKTAFKYLVNRTESIAENNFSIPNDLLAALAGKGIGDAKIAVEVLNSAIEKKYIIPGKDVNANMANYAPHLLNKISALETSDGYELSIATAKQLIETIPSMRYVCFKFLLRCTNSSRPQDLRTLAIETMKNLAFSNDQELAKKALLELMEVQNCYFDVGGEARIAIKKILATNSIKLDKENYSSLFRIYRANPDFLFKGFNKLFPKLSDSYLSIIETTKFPTLQPRFVEALLQRIEDFDNNELNNLVQLTKLESNPEFAFIGRFKIAQLAVLQNDAAIYEYIKFTQAQKQEISDFLSSNDSSGMTSVLKNVYLCANISSNSDVEKALTALEVIGNMPAAQSFDSTNIAR